MTSTITGAAIGFLCWAVPMFIGLFGGRQPQPSRYLASLIIFTGSGAAIGWLIGGAA